MTDLTITPNLIAELHNAAQRGANAGLMLTSEGWEVRSWIDTSEIHHPVAMTAEDLSVLLDGEPLDKDLAAELASGAATSADYQVRDEDGEISSPAADADVVVALTSPDNEDGGWAGAWWFDANNARELVGEQKEDRERGKAESLWITAAGRYVVRLDSVINGEHTVWYEISEDDAAAFLYDAPGLAETTQGADLPVLVRAARLARELADLITPPPGRTIPGEYGTTDYRVDHELATERFAAAGIIGDLVRTRVTADLRTVRATIARQVHRSTGRSTAETHRILSTRRELSYGRVQDLLA